MKNLFLALALLFMGSFGFANEKIDNKIISDNYEEEFKNFKFDTHNKIFIVNNLRGAVLCLVTASKSFTTDLGVTHTQTITYVQWALDESHCSLINSVTQYLYENSSGL